MHEFIGNLGVARDRLHLTSLRIRPEGVRTTFAFEMTAMVPKVAEHRRALHSSVTVSRSTSSGTPRRASSRRFLKNELDGLGEALARLLLRSALAISPWDFRAVGDVPVPVAFEDGGKLVLHGCLRRACHVRPKYTPSRVSRSL